nr:hypothetical protein [Mesorhizobium sp.]
MRFPDVLQGFLKKIEVGRLLSDETLQFADPSQCFRKLVKRFRGQCRRCTARVMRLTQPACRSRRTHATAQSCWPACTKLLLPLIETLARDAELAPAAMRCTAAILNSRLNRRPGSSFLISSP